MRGICTKKIGAKSQLGAEKMTFPTKPDRHTYLQIDRRTDISFYKVALLKKTHDEPFLSVKTVGLPYYEPTESNKRTPLNR